MRAEDLDRVWEAVFADAPVAAGIVDAAGIGVRANAAAARLMGRPEHELVGATWWQITASEQRDEIMASVSRLRAGDLDRYVAAVRWVRTDGRAVSVEVQVTAVRDHADALAGMLLVASDTTGRDDVEAQVRAQFREVFETAPIGMAVLDLDRHFIDVNPEMAAIAHAPREALIGRLVDDFIDAESLPGSYADVAALYEGRGGYRALRRGHRPDGTTLWLLISSTLLRNHTGAPYALFSQALDVTDSTEATARAERQVAQLAALAEIGQQALAAAPLAVLDAQAVATVVRHVGATGCAVMERRGEQLCTVAWQGPSDACPATRCVTETDEIGLVFASANDALVPGEDDAVRRGRTAVSVPVRHQDTLLGVLVAYWPTAGPPPDGATEFLRSVANVLAGARVRRVTEDELAHAATHDPLTGLGNRRLFQDELVHAIARARRQPGVTALLAVDLDRFKAVNDTYGHPVGDAVLRDVAARLRNAVRDADTVARLGGDEFVVLAEALPPGELDALRQRVRQVVADPLQIGDAVITVGASVGMVHVSAEHTVEELLAAVDRALYEDKAPHRDLSRESGD